MSQWKIKETKKWAYEFQYQGERYKREGFNNRASALSAESEKRKELKKKRNMTPTGSWVDVVTEYLDHCRHYTQKNTWRQKANVYRSFLSTLSPSVNPPFEEITRKMILKFISSTLEDKNAKTANRYLRELNSLFNWAILEIGPHIRNPCMKIQKFPEDVYVKYVPPPPDMLKVKLAATGNERDFIEVLYHAVGRTSEAVRLTWEDVNFESRWVRMWTRKRKGGGLEAQYKPMNETLHEILLRRWKHRDPTNPKVFNFTTKELRFMMDRLCKRAGVEPSFGFHAIRHFVLSLINDSGKASVKQIQELAGHKRQSTTEIYLHSMGDATRSAIAILDDNLGEKIKSPTAESHGKTKSRSEA